MTEKPLSERIRRHADIALDRAFKAGVSGREDQANAHDIHAETLGFLAELAEMMEKK